MSSSTSSRKIVGAVFLLAALLSASPADASRAASDRQSAIHSCCTKSPAVFAQVKKKPGAALAGEFRDKLLDVVGLGARTGPDGKVDGHITLRVDTLGVRRVIRSIRLESADRGGVWESSGSARVLAVFREGRRLNARGKALYDSVKGKVRYEMYVPAADAFAPSREFRVTVLFNNNGQAANRFRVPPPAAVPAVVSHQGIDRDVVGQSNSPAPDGEKDGHFTLELDTRGAARVVQSIAIRSVYPTGDPDGGPVWDTKPGAKRILGVLREGRRLNPAAERIKDPIQGKVRYEMYAGDAGRFRPGQFFKVSVSFQGGGTSFAFARVKGPSKPTLIAKYRGNRYDVVGRGKGSRERPDGKRDAQFSLTLDLIGKPRVISAISILTANEFGEADNRGTWNTALMGAGWTLGVYWNNRRVSPSDKPMHEEVYGVVNYDVFASAAAKRFGPNPVVMVKVRFTDGEEATTTMRIPPPPKAGLVAVYRGIYYDVVGKYFKAARDGKKDAQISLTLDTLGRPRGIKDILIETADSMGNFDNQQRWSINPVRSWALGVYQNRRPLNVAGRTVNGVARYELYASTGNYFRPGRIFRVIIRFADEGDAVAIIRVPTAAP